MSPVYTEQIGRTEAHETRLTRAFTGRAGRSIRTRFVDAAAAEGAPSSAPYPVQRGLTRLMREAAVQAGDAERMQMWAGQAARMAVAEPAAEIAQKLWDQAKDLLGN